eukprot:4523124-Amphidinium_carterae.2
MHVVPQEGSDPRGVPELCQNLLVRMVFKPFANRTHGFGSPLRLRHQLMDGKLPQAGNAEIPRVFVSSRVIISIRDFGSPGSRKHSHRRRVESEGIASRLSDAHAPATILMPVCQFDRLTPFGAGSVHQT